MHSLQMVWRGALGLVAVVLAAVAALGGHVPLSHAPGPYKATPADLNSRGRFFGFAAPSAPYDVPATKKIIATAGCNPAVIESYVRASNPFNPQLLTMTSKDYGAIPLVSLEPWSKNEYGADHPDWALSTIISGQHDKDFTAVAKQIATYHGPVLLRFAHEMNGTWYPWAHVGTNTPQQYVAAWRHVWTLFQQAKVTNVLWVWAPNNGPGLYEGANAYYPGDAYVDFVGISGYGINETMPAEAYDGLIKTVRQATRKPIFLSEMGTNANPNKPKWIAALGDWLAKTPEVRGFVWFNYPQIDDQLTDWRFNQSKSDLTAFKQTLKKANINCSLKK